MHHHPKRVLVILFTAVLAVGLAVGTVNAVGTGEQLSLRQSGVPEGGNTARWSVAEADLSVFAMLGIAMACAAGCAVLLSK